MRALGMKYIFIDCISTVEDDNVYDVLHAKYYDPYLSFSKMVLDWTLRWKIPQEPRALQKQTKRVEMKKNKAFSFAGKQEHVNKWIAL